MAGKPAETHLKDTASVMMGVSKGEVKSKLKKGALRMKQFERPSNEKGGSPQKEVHIELVEVIMSLNESEIKDLISLAASLLT